MAPTDDWQELRRLAPWPEQRAYEELRPVVLFGQAVEERAGETGTPERTLYRRATRFDAEGMASLLPPPKVPKHQRLPPKIRQAIIDLKAEYPAFRANEIGHRATCSARSGPKARRSPGARGGRVAYHNALKSRQLSVPLPEEWRDC